MTFQEFPNRIAAQGQTRTAAEAKAMFEQRRGLLKSQTYAACSMTEVRDEVAAELESKGVLAIPLGNLPAGREMKADVAMFLTSRNGKIVSQRNNDCYTSFGG